MTDSRRVGSPLWIAYEYVAMVIGFASLGIICLAWLPFAMILYPLLPQRLGQRCGRHAIAGGFRFYLGILWLFCGCRFDSSDFEQLAAEGPLIIAANHPSLLDAVIILSRLPNAVCVMKASLMDNILFGAAARLAGYVRNQVPLEMVLDSRDRLQQGSQLLIFPEGTRTVNFPIDACTPSAGLIASRTGVPVQTLLIEFSTPYLGKAWSLTRPPPLPLRCRIRLGRRFPAPVDTQSFTAEVEAYFRTELGQNSPSNAAFAA